MNKQFETLDEVEIVQLAKDGDEKAFEFIVKKYQNKVANLIFKIIGDASIVEFDSSSIFLMSSFRYSFNPGFLG